MVSEREKKRSYWYYNKGVARGYGCLQGNTHQADPASMGGLMESDDATCLVSADEKCGLSARVGLSTDGVLSG